MRGSKGRLSYCSRKEGLGGVPSVTEGFSIKGKRTLGYRYIRWKTRSWVIRSIKTFLSIISYSNSFSLVHTSRMESDSWLDSFTIDLLSKILVSQCWPMIIIVVNSPLPCLFTLITGFSVYSIPSSVLNFSKLGSTRDLDSKIGGTTVWVKSSRETVLSCRLYGKLRDQIPNRHLSFILRSQFFFKTKTEQILFQLKREI